MTRRAVLRVLGALAVSVALPRTRAGADVAADDAALAGAPRLHWRREVMENRLEGVAPDPAPAKRRRFGNAEEEGVERFRPDWEVSDGKTPAEHLRILSVRTLFLASAGLFTLFGRAVSDRETQRIKLPERYDPAAVEKYFWLRPDRIVGRLLQLSAEALRLIALDVRQKADELWNDGGLTPGARALRAAARREQRAAALRAAVTRLGPAFVKLAQAAAMRPDIVGAELARQLQAMQDCVIDPFPVVDALALIRDELGAMPKAIFDLFDTEPIAGASLGLVFRGVIDGRDVAVKVQRPEVAESIALDVYILRSAIGLGARVFGWRRELKGVLDEYAARLFEELDYRNEAANMRKFESEYGGMPLVVIPRPFEAYTSRKVLVSEFVNGHKLIDVDCEVRASELSVVETGIHFALTQLLGRGLLHCDMHNGNLLCTDRGEIALIDFGVICEIPPSVQEAIVLVLFYLMQREYELFAQACTALALYGTEDVEDELDRFAAAAAKEFGEDEVFTLVGVAEKMVVLGAQFPFILNQYFVNAIRCLGMLEGLAINADRSFSMVNVVYPAVVRIVLAGEEGSAYRAALEKVLRGADGTFKWDKLDSMLREVRRAENAGVGGRRRRRRVAEPLDEFLLSKRGGFLRRQIMRENKLPRAAGVFRRASVSGKVRAMCVFLPALVVRALLLMLGIVVRVLRRFLVPSDERERVDAGRRR